MKADTLKASFWKLKKEILCSVVTWGITGDIVNESEKWRILGKKWYAFVGLKKFIQPTKIKAFRADIHVKNEP